ncbi:MAG TPA: heterodisulfide reductase-related iron-sulfur binding cluster, partial [Longimicrobiales bacterium]|nr:heterodisulfide reductase-related iron-sulfur binding cluster [Longimicrobiales bacterium]
ACPTYNRLGDEADSPRGRLHLMKAVVEGRLDPASDAFRTHIDRCLGCRACEPVCPSGVEYGTLLELARHTVSTRGAPQGPLTRSLLLVMARRPLRGALFLAGRLLRAVGLPALGARLLPGVGALRSVRLGLAMLAATTPWRPPVASGSVAAAEESPRPARTKSAPAAGPGPAPAASPDEDATPQPGGRVGVLVGCVQAGLYERVNRATVRTLEANGYEVVAVRGQDCCGALHAHGGDRERAISLARGNVDAFLAADVELVAVNAAGCGAAMKEYGTLLADDPDYGERARELSSRVRDVTELLAAAGPRPGAEVRCAVAYDHPCHLLHAQRVERAPLEVLAAVPGLDVRLVPRADECCGGAGIYGITHPDLGGRIGRDKVEAVRSVDAEVVVTPNPGCMMQIGAGLTLEGSREGVAHPVELLDESYRRAGLYAGEQGR